MKRGALLLIAVIVVVCMSTQTAFSADHSCTNCFDHVSTGSDHSCAVREDGSLTCWGRDGDGQATPPSLGDNYDFAQVSAGGFHTCAVVNCYPSPGVFCPFGNVRCWGLDTSGQATPGINDRFSQVSSGRYFTCGVKGGSIACWGSDGQGQSSPPSPPASREFIQVSAGGYHACGVTACTSFPCLLEKNVTCWGDNSYDQTTVPGSLFPQYSQVSAGKYHTCGVMTDDSVACWGRNVNGEATPPAGSFQHVSAGGYHTCGLKMDGSVECWGYGFYGQTTPPAGSFKQVSSGEYHTCGTRTDGSITCWGRGDFNQTLPTAGLCGLFHDDFEGGGDCRWSTGSTPCWTADCDGDGYASQELTGYCISTPIGVPAECPTGSWTDQPAVPGAYDCLDDNEDVHCGQTSYFSTGYGMTGGHTNLFDYNCDGEEEKRYNHINGGSLHCVSGQIIGTCTFACPPPPTPCYTPGWDPASVTEIPECGETADYVTCGTGIFIGQCVSKTVQNTQDCR